MGKSHLVCAKASGATSVAEQLRIRASFFMSVLGGWVKSGPGNGGVQKEASPGFLKENDKNAMEKSYSKSIVTALGQYGNSKLSYVPSDRISFVEEAESEKES